MLLEAQYDKNIMLTIDKPENSPSESRESNSDPKGTHWPKVISCGVTVKRVETPNVRVQREVIESSIKTRRKKRPAKRVETLKVRVQREVIESSIKTRRKQQH